MTIILRRVKLPEDADTLYYIYMSDDVLPFMNFDQEPRQYFVDKTLPLLNSSGNELYVLEVNGVIVGARKIRLGVGSRSHVAYLGAFAIHPEHRRCGYGNRMLQEIRNMLGDSIKRIEISQESDNDGAFILAKKQSFLHEYTVLDWMKRFTC